MGTGEQGSIVEPSEFDLAAQIANLVYALRARGFTADTRQAIALEQLLTSLESKWHEPNFDLASHIGPIFCRSQQEQRRFREAIDGLQWRDEQLNHPSPDSNSTLDSGLTPGEPSKPSRQWIVWLALAGCAIIVIAIVTWGPKKGTTEPIEGTGGSGTSVSNPTNTEIPKPVQTPSEDEYARLLSYHRVAIREPLAKPATASWLWASVPVLFLGGWLLYNRSKRPRLRRESSNLPQVFTEVRLPGNPAQPFARLGVRELSRSMRIRQRVASRELNTELTITRTIENGGMPTPVFESYIEPRYLVLLDRAGASDHFNKLAHQLLHTLQIGNVDCVTFDFDRNPTYCNIPQEQRIGGGRFRYRLSEILDQQPNRPLMILSDGAGFIDPLTNASPEWFGWVSDRPRVLVTPADPKVDWTLRETKLRSYGFQVIPMTPTGIPEVASVLSGIESSRRVSMRMPLTFEDEPDRCMSRFDPSAEFIQQLCNELRGHLNEDGFLWLASLAAYPEIHWGLTLRLGASLLGADRWEELLPRLSRLIWLRQGFMPDWLRTALLSQIPSKDEQHIRQLLFELLSQGQSAASTNANVASDIPLRIVIEQPQSIWARARQLWSNWRTLRASTMETWIDRLRNAWSHKMKKQDKSEEGRFDYVYLRFLSGSGPKWLTQMVPANLIRALFPKGWMFGPSVWLATSLLLLFSVVSFITSEKLRHYRFQVTAMEVSNNGEQILTRHSNGTLSGWRMIPVTTLELVNDTSLPVPVFYASFLQGGDQIITGTSFTADVWDAASGLPLRSENWTYAANIMACSPNGKQIVTGSQDNNAYLWDVTTGKQLLEFKGHSAGVFGVAFSQDGKQIVTGSSDKSARAWDAATGKLLRELKGHAEAVLSVAFSPDGKQIVTGSLDKTARTWNAATGELLREFKGHTDRVLSVAFSPDGKQIVTGSRDNSARAWDAATGNLLQEFKAHTDEVPSVAFSPDGKQIATGSMDKTVRTWDYTTGKSLQEFRGHTYGVIGVAFSPDGKQIVTGSNDGTARVWDLSTEKLDWTTSDSRNWSGMSSDGARRAMRDRSGSIKVYDAKKLEPIFQLESKNSAQVVAISDDGAYLAVAKPNNVEFHSIDHPNDPPSSKNTKIAEPLGNMWAGNQLVLWDNKGNLCTVSPDKEAIEFKIPSDVSGHVLSSDFRTLTFWSKNDSAILLDLDFPSKNVDLQYAKLALAEPVSRVKGATYDSESKHLLVWYEDGSATVYLTDFTKVPEADLGMGRLKVGESPRSAFVSQSGYTVATLLEDGSLRFQVASFLPAKTRSEPLAVVANVKQVAQGDNDTLAVVFLDGSVRLYDAEFGVPLSDPLPTSGSVTLAAFGRPNSVKSDLPRPAPKAAADNPANDKPVDENPREQKPDENPAEPADKKSESGKYETGKSAFTNRKSSSRLTSYASQDAPVKEPAKEEPVNGNKSKSDEPAKTQSSKSDYPPSKSEPEQQPPVDKPPIVATPEPQVPDNRGTALEGKAPDFRQSLALTTASGNIELWELDNAGRGVVLLVNSMAIGKDVFIAQNRSNELAFALKERYGFEHMMLEGQSIQEVKKELELVRSTLQIRDRFVLIVTGDESSTAEGFEIPLDQDGKERLSSKDIQDFLNELPVSQKLMIVDTPNSSKLVAQKANSSFSTHPPTLIIARGNSTAYPENLLERLTTELKGKAAPRDVRTLFNSINPKSTADAADPPYLFGTLIGSDDGTGSNFYFPAPRQVSNKAEAKK